MTKKFKTLTERTPAHGASTAIPDLVRYMEASFAQSQTRAGGPQVGDAPSTSEDELESLVGEAIRTASRSPKNALKRKASRR